MTIDNNSESQPSDSGELKDGDVIERTYPAKDGDITVSAPVSVENDGKTVRLEISAFPSGSSTKRAEPGIKEVRKAIRQLENEARDAGFEQLRITAYRTKNATFDPETFTLNPGRRIDITIDINK